MNSGASKHVVTSARYLSEVEKIPATTIKLGDGTKVNVIHKDIVIVDVAVRNKILCRPYLIPTLKLNIISGLRLDKYGVKSTLGRGIYTLRSRDERSRVMISI